MKKLFFTLLTLCLAMPFSAWADEHEDHNSGNVGEGHGDVGDEVYDGEEEEDLGSIVPSEVQLTYKILSVPAGTFGDEGYANGTVELEGLYYAPSGTIGSLYIPHEIQVVNVSVEGTVVTTEVNLYTVIGIAMGAFGSLTKANADQTITSVTIPYTVTYLGQDDVTGTDTGCFTYCQSLSSVTFAESSSNASQLETIGTSAFQNCTGLTSIDIPSSVKTIGSSAFQGCSALTAINFPSGSSLTTISQSAFQACSALTEVAIPSGVTSLSNSEFYNCTNLKTVWLPGSIQLTGNVFRNCTSLSAIVLEGGPGENGGTESGEVFNGDNGEAITLYVETGLAPEYLASAWETDVESESSANAVLSWNFNEITISASGYSSKDEKYYGTYYTDADGEFYTDVDPCIVYEVVENGEVDYQSIAEANTYAKIPAGTALLLAADQAETTYYYHPYTFAMETYASTEGNLLYGSSEVTTTNVNGTTDGYYFYKLSRNAAGEAGSVGFYWGAEDGAAFESAAGKAWLAIAITEKTSGISGYTFGNGAATGITAVESATESAKKGIYTISGVRVNDMSKAGLYIVDGKKVIVK